MLELAADERLLEHEGGDLGVGVEEVGRVLGRPAPEVRVQEAGAREHHPQQGVRLGQALVQLRAQVQHLYLRRVRPGRLQLVDAHARDGPLEVVQEELVRADVHVDVQLVGQEPGVEVLAVDAIAPFGAVAIAVAPTTAAAAARRR